MNDPENGVYVAIKMRVYIYINLENCLWYSAEGDVAIMVT